MMTLISTPLSIGQFLLNPISRLCSFAFHLVSISRMPLSRELVPAISRIET